MAADLDGDAAGRLGVRIRHTGSDRPTIILFTVTVAAYFRGGKPVRHPGLIRGQSLRPSFRCRNQSREMAGVKIRWFLIGPNSALVWSEFGHGNSFLFFSKLSLLVDSDPASLVLSPHFT